MRNFVLTVALCSILPFVLPVSGHAAQLEDAWRVPVEVKTLDNGLTVVVSQDHSSPTVGVSVVYHVGTRLEPRDRSGFAHLFEHLMFEGSPNARKGTFERVITGGGGFYNGSTSPDVTNYIAIAPTTALEPILWLEADRMRGLDFSPASLGNQRDVVKEEIRVNVKNQPYGGFMWIDINQHAFHKWENGHDGYGSFEDLESASLEDVVAFHRDYYGPNNAVIGIAGDIAPAEAFALVEKYFGGIEARPAPKAPDFSEGLNTREKRLQQTDGLAQVPAIVSAWKLPVRGSRDHAPMVVLGELLGAGNTSRFYQGLVKGRQIALNIDTHGLVGPWEYDGPTLFTVFALYKPTTDADAVLAALDEEIGRITTEGVGEAELARVKTRMLADWYNHLEPFLARADILARLHTVWGDANLVNTIPAWIEAVTAADLQRVAKTYLSPANRTAIDRVPIAMVNPATGDAFGVPGVDSPSENPSTAH